jgi:hypothetical protein
MVRVMRALIFLGIGVVVVGCNIQADPLILVDSIQVVVYGPETTSILTNSDVYRRGIDGSTRTLDEKIFERKVYDDAVKFKMVPTKEEAEKRLQIVQKDNNISREQMVEIFKAGGYTYEQGLEQFQTMTAVNQIMSFKIMSRLIVPESEIKAYYEENPQYTQASYYIRRAEVPATAVTTKQELKEKLQNNTFYNSIAWSMPFWIDESEVAAEKQFIFKMEKNQITIVSTIDGFELFELVDKKEAQLIPFEQRYEEIVATLRQPKYQMLLEKYKKELEQNSVVVYQTPPQP